MLTVVLMRALWNFWRAFDFENSTFAIANDQDGGEQGIDATIESKQKSQCSFCLHLIVYLVFFFSWIFFGSVLWYVYTSEENTVMWYLTLTAFILGIVSQAVLMSSILYAIYWLYQTGEVIKRDRERAQKVKN